jgi:UDP-glucose 4-epimerase
MNYFIVGGAGFIGSSLVHRLLDRHPLDFVTVYDNFSTGKREFFKDIKNNPNLTIIKGDAKDLPFLTLKMRNMDVVYHFASNADISKAMTHPSIDFWEGTYLTHNVLEAMRINKVKKIIYASGSGVYGDHHSVLMHEFVTPMLPVSTYGASKLAGEALISAYCHMFDMQGRVYRFANVIGKNQTHGIISDIIGRLKKNSKELEVLGDGSQNKCYIHISDILNAISMTEGGNEQYEYYNVSSETNITVAEIVNMILEEMGLFDITKVKYGDTPGGWQGDIPVVRLDASKIKRMGWEYIYNSEKAVEKTIKEILGK